MDFRRNVLVVAGTALAYYVLFVLNQFLFSALTFSAGTSWVFLPSGVCLFAILLFALWGALGVVLGAMGFALLQSNIGSDPLTLGVSICLCGLAPLLARQICLGSAELNANLQGLSATGLLRVAAIFSAVSAGLHQLWFAWRGVSNDIVGGLAAMFTGDMLGILIVLYMVKMSLSLGERLRGG